MTPPARAPGDRSADAVAACTGSCASSIGAASSSTAGRTTDQGGEQRSSVWAWQQAAGVGGKRGTRGSAVGWRSPSEYSATTFAIIPAMSSRTTFACASHGSSATPSTSIAAATGSGSTSVLPDGTESAMRGSAETVAAMPPCDTARERATMISPRAPPPADAKSEYGTRQPKLTECVALDAIGARGFGSPAYRGLSCVYGRAPTPGKEAARAKPPASTFLNNS